MNNGIEILNKTEIMKWTSTFPGPTIVAVIAIIAIIIVSICLIIETVVKSHVVEFTCKLIELGVFIVMAIGCTVVAGIWSLSYKNVPTGRYRYEVIIDDDTDFNEIRENYSIIEAKGNFYVIEDKE